MMSHIKIILIGTMATLLFVAGITAYRYLGGRSPKKSIVYLIEEKSSAGKEAGWELMEGGLYRYDYTDGRLTQIRYPNGRIVTFPERK